MEKYFIKKRYTSFLYSRDGNIIPKIVEYRENKLFDTINIINPERLHIKTYSKNDILIEKKNNEKSCKFNKNNLFRTNEVIYEGYDSFIIYNLHPYYEKHGLYIPSTSKHVSDILELSWLDIYHMFVLSKEHFFDQNYRDNANLKYTIITINHGHGAGASIEHLHFHLLQSEMPTINLSKYIEVSTSYFKDKGSILTDDLVNYEKNKDERFIYEGKVINFVTPFTHIGFFEVWGIVKGFNILKMARSRLEELSKELYNFIKCYRYSLGMKYFNMSIYDTSYLKEPGVSPLIRIISRPEPLSNAICMEGYMESLEETRVLPYYPEDIARLLKGSCEKYTKDVPK